MKKYLYILLLLGLESNAQITTYRNNQTVTYAEAIEVYTMLDNKYEQGKLLTYGLTDAGKPLHLFIISSSKVFNADELHKKNECIILINNGIHPGEPDGIDASIEFCADILSGRIKMPDHVVLAVVPVYNIDGSLNRGCCSRANQNGPEEYGFRGNARNLDLNRDFIKADAANTKSLTAIFREWDPDIFIDNHVSDGADYQHVITLIATQKDKLNPYISDYMQNKLLPPLYAKMKENNFPMCPYVNVWKSTPDNGFEGFLETPRFATGYSTLFNTIGFVTETHMFKPYAQRVEATYMFMHSVLMIAGKDYATIKDARSRAKKDCINRKTFSLQWELDSTYKDSILFKGYEAGHKKSNVTGMDRLYYDRSKPYEKYIPYYNKFRSTVEVNKPVAYIIPQAWREVIDRLKLNNVAMTPLTADTTIDVNAYYIRSYKSSDKPYEGHHMNTSVKTEKVQQSISFFKGDYIIYCNQEANRYIVETMEPQGVDSWFTWGFFDAILQQKEWYSDYIFIDQVEDFLEKDPILKSEFEEKKKTDNAFATDSGAMLTWLYQHSPYYEKSHNRYPVYRIE